MPCASASSAAGCQFESIVSYDVVADRPGSTFERCADAAPVGSTSTLLAPRLPRRSVSNARSAPSLPIVVAFLVAARRAVRELLVGDLADVAEDVRRELARAGSAAPSASAPGSRDSPRCARGSRRASARGTPTATIAGFSGVCRRSSKFCSSCSAVYCGASTSASWPMHRARVGRVELAVDGDRPLATRFSTSTTPLRSRMRPRGDSVCTIARTARDGLDPQVLLGRPSGGTTGARESAQNRATTTTPTMADPDAAVVAHG